MSQIDSIFQSIKNGRGESAIPELMKLQQDWMETHSQIEVGEMSDDECQRFAASLQRCKNNGTPANWLAASIAIEKGMIRRAWPGSPLDQLYELIIKEGTRSVVNSAGRRLRKNVKTTRDLHIGVDEMLDEIAPIAYATSSESEADLKDARNRLHDIIRGIVEVSTHKKPLSIVSGIVQLGEKTSDGVIVEAVALPWLALVDRFIREPECLYDFSNHHRKFEEFIACAYEYAGWDVILTPSSNDKGRDIIATKSGVVSVRIFDQAKAFRKDKRVSANDVRAMYGTLRRHDNVSKAIVSTTAEIAPGVYDEFRDNIPYELELRDQKELMKWLTGIAKRRSQRKLKLPP